MRMYKFTYENGFYAVRQTPKIINKKIPLEYRNKFVSMLKYGFEQFEIRIYLSNYDKNRTIFFVYKYIIYVCDNIDRSYCSDT